MLHKTLFLIEKLQDTCGYFVSKSKSNFCVKFNFQTASPEARLILAFICFKKHLLPVLSDCWICLVSLKVGENGFLDFFFMVDVLNLVNFVSVFLDLSQYYTRWHVFRWAYYSSFIVFFSKLDLLGLLFTRVYLFSWVYLGYFDEWICRVKMQYLF